MYNVFLEEKRQRERTASVPEVLSGAALKRRQALAQRYHTRVESFMRQKQIAGEVDAVNDVADVPKSEFRTRDRSKEIGPPSISLNPYVPEKKRIEMAAILCPPSLASQEIYRPAKLATARSENRHLDLHPPLRLKCSTEIQRIAETLEQRGSTLGASSSTKTALREVNHDKWVQDRDFMPPKRRPEPTPMSFVLSAEAYDDPLLQRKSAQPAAHAARKPRVSCSAGRPLPKSYYTAINEMSVAPPHVAAMSHAVGDERAAAAMQLVASRLQSRNCGTPSFPILGPKMADAL